MNIHIYVEHDIIIRHFILSRAFENLVFAGHDVKVIMPPNATNRVTYVPKSSETNLPIYWVEASHERVFWWKRLFFIQKFRLAFGKSERAIRRAFSSTIGWKGNLQFTFLALPGIRNLFTLYCRRKIANLQHNALRKWIVREAPDLIIHPSVLSGVYFDDLIEISSEQNIPMLAIMNSWDNPSTKHGATGVPAYLLVWGEQTKQHAMKYMKLASQQIVSFGAAQFDVYRQPPLDNPISFRKLHGLPDDCRLLLYAGSSKGTAEVEHLDALDRLIEDGTLPTMKVLYRPHPWGGGGRGGKRILERSWKHISIESSMLEYLESVRDGSEKIYLANYENTHNVLSNVDYVVSPLSTIILEGLMHRKPAMCFLPLGENEASHFQMARELPHFEEMFEMEIIPKAFSVDELADGIKDLIELERDPEMSAKIDCAVSVFVKPFEAAWKERFPQLCENIVKGNLGEFGEDSA